MRGLTQVQRKHSLTYAHSSSIGIGRKLHALWKRKNWNAYKKEFSSREKNLPNLEVLKFGTWTWTGCRIHGISKISHLRSLKQLDLKEYNTDGISQCFPNLYNLQWLTLSWCEDLTERPESFVSFWFLQKLELTGCTNLKQLPAGFGESTNLTELNLSYCLSLQEIPRDLGKLTSLQSWDIAHYSSLIWLPEGLGGLMSVWGSKIDFSCCSSLSELPEEICKNTMLTSISLRSCRRLKTLPSKFGEITCLKYLDLSGCESLQELCNDFHCLGGLRELYLNNCKSLSSLPLGIGKLSSLIELDLSNCETLSSLPVGFETLTSLETLDLSGCNKSEELCSDFHCLVALKYLNLSKCDSLCNLPDRFGELGCLESLDLSECSHLLKISDDFHLLPSLTRLNLSKCESLGGEWMDCVGNIRSLWRLDIVDSKRMIQRWMETKSQKERNMVVVADFPQGEEGERALLLEGVLSKVFDEEGLLVDADEHPFHSYSLQPQTQLILMIDSKYDNHKWKSLGKNLQQLQRNSKELQIIYVGRRFKSLSSELAIRMLAYTPDNSRTSAFYHKLSASFNTGSIAVFRSTDKLEENGLKCLSAWEDMSSYMLDAVDFLTNTPRESNIEFLKELLVAEKVDHLLLTENRQVKVATLQGKLILLVITYLHENLELHTSAIKEMYLKMQESHDNYVFEVVCVPLISSENTWEEFVNAAASATWPVVPNPWLIDRDRIRSFIGWSQETPCVCVVDEKGRISQKDAMPMIERWGVEAYPFSQSREEELRKEDSEEFKINSLSTLQFVFQNLEFLSNKAKEMMDREVMKLICVGPPEKMIKLIPDLNCAFTMLEMDFQVFYVSHRGIGANAYDMACEKLKENESEMCNIATLSFSVIHKFWRRVWYLQNDLINGMGTDERTVKVRRMVLALASAYSSPWEMSIVLVDGNGEIVSGRGMEVVQLLFRGEEDDKSKLVEEIKKEGIEKSLKSSYDSSRKMSIVVVDGNGEMATGRDMQMVEVLCDGEEDSKEKLVKQIKNRLELEKSAESRLRWNHSFQTSSPTSSLRIRKSS
ncbi:hypothetical protein SUGI_1143260 [Cryptomeria japonica]|nr:hypothetical protein SUGI_1143260 [Cryptomeria japonica]